MIVTLTIKPISEKALLALAGVIEQAVPAIGVGVAIGTPMSATKVLWKKESIYRHHYFLGDG